MTSIDCEIRQCHIESKKLYIHGLPVALTLIFVGTVTSLNSAFSQTDEGNNVSSTTPLEELQNQSFSQVAISSAQVEEFEETIDNANEAAQSGSMSNVLVQLKILHNQIDVI